MVALPVVANVARFSLRYSYGGDSNVLNRFFMKYTGAMGSVDATTLCTTLASSWTTRFNAMYPTTLTLIDTGCLDLGSRTGINVILPVSHPGTAAASLQLSAGAAIVIDGHVALRYRGGHPRVYLPPAVNSSLADANTWATANLATIFTAWTGMLADLASSPPLAVGALSQVGVRYYSNNILDYPPGTVTVPPNHLLPVPMALPIGSWSVNPQVGSQRRRNQQ